jgi:Tfp pilus assembly protein PilV
MAVLKASQVKAATLIEVIVALVIITIIFGVSTMIYVNVLHSSYSHRQFNASLVVKEVCEETLATKRYFDEQADRKNVTITKTVSRYRDMLNIIHLHVEATAGEQILFSRDMLIDVSGEEKN